MVGALIGILLWISAMFIGNKMINKIYGYPDYIERTDSYD